MPQRPLPALETIAGQRVLFVMAAPAEYGPHLKARIAPLMTGIGPIEAALAMGIALADCARHGSLPDRVVSLGSAGSRICRLGEVFQISSVSWRDIDASPLGFPKGVTPLVDHPVDMPLHTPLALPKARLSTGGNVVSGEAYAAIDADMVDMETFAIARACQLYDLPLIGLRGVSDGPGELAGYHDWTELLALLDERLAGVIDLLPGALAATQKDS